MQDSKPNREELVLKLLKEYNKVNISSNEFITLFKKMNIPNSQLEEIFNNIDKNKSGSIDLKEIIDYFKFQENKLRDLFNSIDIDKNGKISLSELKFALQNLNVSDSNFKYNDDLLSDIIRIYDKNNDNLIDFDEWKDILYFVPNVNLNYAINWSMNTTASLSFFIDSIPLQLFQESSKSTDSNYMKFINNFVSGGLSAAIARTLTAPFDRLKTLYQLNYKGDMKPPSLFTGLKEIVRNDGIKGLFRGNFVNILKASPDASIKLTLFEYLKAFMKKDSDLSPQKLFIAGSISGVISCMCVYPMEVIKIRLSGSPTGTYNGINDVIKKMYLYEGGLKSYFKGFSAAFASSLPNSGLNLSIYDILRKAAFKIMNKESLPVPFFMAIGAVSAAITTTCLYPLNLVSARMIMQGLNNKDQIKLNMLQIMSSIYNKEGIIGFYKGFTPTTTKIFLGSGISFGAYEFCKKIFKPSK